jgi:C1A family cysteine protease
MKFATILVLICVAYACAAVIPESVNQQFIEFQAKYGKVYGNANEYKYRLGIFADNLQRAEKMNSENENTEFGVTKFMDMTPEEFRANVLMTTVPPLRNSKQGPYHYSKFNASAPSSFDWRSKSGVVTPVYNQGQCGSCWAFSATENIESQWALGGHTLTSLSMQQIVDCDKMDYGCGGGWPYHAYEYVISAGGQDSYASYPYTAENGACVFKSADVVAKLRSWTYVTQSESESEMVDYLYAHGPLSVCVDAASWMYYTGGVFMASACSTSIDHCVEAIGYNIGASTPYWIIRNSWGTDWGIAGYMQLQYGQDACAVAQVVTNSLIA